MTRLLVIGDTHLHQGPRNADRLSALQQIVAALHGLSDVGAIVWAGDLFHQKSTPQDRLDLAAVLEQLAAVAPVLIVRGNHDGAGELELFARLKTAWPIHVVTTVDARSIILATGERATVGMLAYPQKAMLVAAGVASPDVVATADALLDPIFMDLAAQLEAARGRGELTWFMTHANIAGSRSSAGQPLIGQEIELRQGHLDRLGPILKIANHIHLPQEIFGAIYPGSIAPMDYGETHEPRFLVVDMEDSFTFAIESRPIRVPRTVHVDGRLTREGFYELEGEDPHHAYIVDWSGQDVRVRYRCKASERGLVDEQVLRTIFETAARLKVECVAEPDRELRAPAVAAATTVADKLAAYRREPQLASSIAAKLSLLEHDDVDALRGAVAKRLDAIAMPAASDAAMVAA